MNTDAARRWVIALRKPAKKAYAEAYWAWLVHTITTGEDVAEPVRPANLNTMAAQAVRMRLQEYTK